MMRECDENRIITSTLSYLGNHKQEGALVLFDEIRECIKELKREAKFRSRYEIYELETDQDGFLMLPALGLSLASTDAKHYFAGCHRILALAVTLGMEFERYEKRVMATDMSHALILDAAASAYLEDRADALTEELLNGPHTYRFAPGYGDLPLALNVHFANALQIEKRIGMMTSAEGAFQPFKSMLGLTGIGTVRERACGNCIRGNDCFLRKEGETCWK